MPVQNTAAFHDEARWQRACANCGATGAFHAHHVVDKQTLKKYISGCSKNDKRLYDTRNALRLCDGLDTRRCHMNMEWGNGRVRVSTSKLTDDNIAYAWEILGPYAIAYLRTNYDDSKADPRIMELELTL